ncbi:30S ribosomal protein S7 [Candidatus Woesearchaeota archaeon]|nr:30S ribosomal protein S7 [Candidatus Woesearchaeota archaeon]
MKAFNTWDVETIKIEDAGLQKYVSLQPRLVPKTGGKYAKKRFYKSKIFFVERLINKIMVPGHKSKKHWRTSGHNTGQAAHAYKVVFSALKLVEEKTKKNPLEVLAKALENAAPREEIVTIEYGGARYPKAVDCAPQRRIDICLRYFVQGAYAKSFNTKVRIHEALAEELIAASKLEQKSHAISKKLELERQADASR